MVILGAGQIFVEENHLFFMSIKNSGSMRILLFLTSNNNLLSFLTVLFKMILSWKSESLIYYGSRLKWETHYFLRIKC